MMLHLSHVNKRCVPCGNQCASLRGCISDSVIRHVIFHTRSRKLIDAWAERFFSFSQIETAVLKVQTEWQEDILFVHRDRLSKMHRKVNSRYFLIEFQNNLCVDAARHGVLQAQNGKHRSALFYNNVLQFRTVQFRMCSADVSSH